VVGSSCGVFIMRKFGALSGWIGMVFIQLATIPTIAKLLLGTSERLPPLDLVLMIWVGLLLFFIRSITHKDMFYIISNGTGFFLQSILLFLILK
jgi:hypothetical protein